MYALGLDVIPMDQDILGGRFLLFNSWVCVLFDTSAIHSFISTSFIEVLGLEVTKVARRFMVNSPLGLGTMITGVCRGCVFSFADYEFREDLFVMPFADFDVILGLDWLTKYKAIIECADRRITLTISTGRVRFRSLRLSPCLYFLDNL